MKYFSEQEIVNDHFDSVSAYWKAVYQHKDLYGIIHQRRMSIALNIIDELKLPKTSHILEIGCGAGLMTIALAERGFAVDSIDSVPSMIELTQQLSRQKGFKNSIRANIGDVNNLALQDNSYDLMIALGVTPFLHNLNKALSEVARVLKPGGYFVLSVDNRNRLIFLLDPLTSPLFTFARKMLKNKLERADRNNPKELKVNMYTLEEFKGYLSKVGMRIIQNESVGFGPFSILGHRLFSDRASVTIHCLLQRKADLGNSVLRATGSQFIILATASSYPHGR